MGLLDVTPSTASHHEHPKLREALDEVFNSDYPQSRVREELEEQVARYGVEVDSDATLPGTPYEYDTTEVVAKKWEVMLAEYLLCDESLPDRRYQQAASRATERLECGASTSVTSALTRETFYQPFTIDPERVADETGVEITEPIKVSAPSAELVRDILNETERQLRRREPDVIEQVLAYRE
jgi:hypothetical protein